MLELEFAEQTDLGLQRQNNEDFVGHVLPASPAQVRDQGFLFALADGMGGHEYGEVASRLAIETMLSRFSKIPKGIMHASLLPKLVQEANAAVYDAGHTEAGHASKPIGASMGTTLVACALRFDSAVISHVGDSRCYLFRNGTGSLLTRDHTMAAEQMRLGILAQPGSQSDQDSSGMSHMLTRSLGFDLFVAADTITVNIIPGDVLLLCSDGLHGYVSDPEIARILNMHFALDQAAAALIAAANTAGGGDNVTVQLIRVVGVERMGLYRGRPYRLL